MEEGEHTLLSPLACLLEQTTHGFFATNITPRNSVVIIDSLPLTRASLPHILSVYGVQILLSSSTSNPHCTIAFFSSSYDSSMLFPYRSSISSAHTSSEHYASHTATSSTCQWYSNGPRLIQYPPGFRILYISSTYLHITPPRCTHSNTTGAVSTKKHVNTQSHSLSCSE